MKINESIDRTDYEKLKNNIDKNTKEKEQELIDEFEKLRKMYKNKINIIGNVIKD